MFFITFRLANSLPVTILHDLEAERERARQSLQAQFSGAELREELYKQEKIHFGHFDAWLDRCVEESPRWLADERIAQIVADEIHALDGEWYRLCAYSILSNHVHLAVDTAEHPVTPVHQGVTAPYPLADMLKHLKGRTARFCNQALGRSGGFWQHESYDHLIRDEKEYERIIWYLVNNPVKAGLVEKWEESNRL
jgi:REP element-mobilizing transposase RayT